MENVDNDDGALEWDSEIDDAEDFQLLPAGEADFKVIEYTRKRYTPGQESKIKTCKWLAEVKIQVSNQHGKSIVFHNFYLHQKCQGLLSEFFVALGLKKKGEKLTMDWQKVSGKTGRCKIGTRKGTGQYADKEYQEIKKFIDFDHSASKPDQPPTPGEDPF